jgi:hypothetical protein
MHNRNQRAIVLEPRDQDQANFTILKRTPDACDVIGVKVSQDQEVYAINSSVRKAFVYQLVLPADVHQHDLA